jgi:hypothetical protein
MGRLLGDEKTASHSSGCMTLVWARRSAMRSRQRQRRPSMSMKRGRGMGETRRLSGGPLLHGLLRDQLRLQAVQIIHGALRMSSGAE